MTRRFYLMRHPAVILFYFVAAAGLAMSTYEPFCSALTLFGASVTLFILKGARAYLKTMTLYLFMVLLLAFLNPFYSQSGLTVLFYVGGTPYTIEAFIYGLSAGFSMVATIEWLNALYLALPRGRFLALFSKIAPVTASLISMIFRYMPELLRKSQAIIDSKKGLGVNNGGLKGAVDMSNVLVSWSMEESIETADSMRDRNYGKRRRTSGHDLKLSGRDKLELILIIVFFCFSLFCVIRSEDFLFYPHIRLVSHGWEFLGYVLYVLLPLIAGRYERAIEFLRLKTKEKTMQTDISPLWFYNTWS